jgi:hypothetical protein
MELRTIATNGIRMRIAEEGSGPGRSGRQK